MSQVVGLPNNSYKPITNTAWVRARLCKLQKGCTRLAAASDKVYQLLVHGRWFFPAIPAFSTTKTGRHDIAEILLKVALNTKNQPNRKKCIAQQFHMNNIFLGLVVYGTSRGNISIPFSFYPLKEADNPIPEVPFYPHDLMFAILFSS